MGAGRGARESAVLPRRVRGREGRGGERGEGRRRGQGGGWVRREGEGETDFPTYKKIYVRNLRLNM